MSWVGIERLGSRWFVIELARNTLQDHAFGYRNDTVMRLMQGGTMIAGSGLRKKPAPWMECGF